MKIIIEIKELKPGESALAVQPKGEVKINVEDIKTEEQFKIFNEITEAVLKATTLPV